LDIAAPTPLATEVNNLKYITLSIEDGNASTVSLSWALRCVEEIQSSHTSYYGETSLRSTSERFSSPAEMFYMANALWIDSTGDDGLGGEVGNGD
jgi:hypothetical protein